VGLWTSSADVTRAKLMNLLSVTLGGSIAGQPWKVKFDIGQAKAGEKDTTSGPAVRPGIPDHGLTELAEPSFGYAESRQVTASDEAASRPETYGGDSRRGLPRISANEKSSRANFWHSLHPDQQDVFMAMADRRVFAAGARLMREGEHGDYVAVILSGLTQVRVSENGVEQVLAVRGPGQLIGERAALEMNLRSATVIALQPVEALVVRTADFATFLSTYPEVLKIVEEQIYTRLREVPTRYGPAPANRSDDRASETIAPRPALAGQNCTIIRTDVAEFASGRRSDEDRKIIRAALLAMTRLAMGSAWQTSWWEDRGDGLLLIASPGVPTGQVIERLVTVLRTEIARHNRIYSDPIRIRLRIAVDVGPIEEDEAGVSGKSIIKASRLVDTAAFKEAIAGHDAILGIIVSPFVYETHIEPGGSAIDPAGYTKIPVRVKETSGSAWTQLIGPAGPLALPPRMLAVHGARSLTLTPASWATAS
jgi:CRP-like cAMP-binding protein